MEAEDALLYLYDLIIDILYLYFHLYDLIIEILYLYSHLYLYELIIEMWNLCPPGPRWDPPAQSRQILHDDDADPDLQHDDENLQSLQKWQKLLIISYFLQN